jgi:hypothetical protein
VHLRALAIAAALAAAAPAGAQGAGPVAAYSFDAGSGAAVADASGNGNTGTVTGSAWTSQGRYGSALSFDGADDYVSVPDSASLDLGGSLTVEAWVWPEALSGYHTIAFKGTTTSVNYFLDLLADEVDFGFTSSGWREHVTPSANVPAAAWTHVAAVYDRSANQVRLYTGGVLRATFSQSRNLTSNGAPLRIGASPFGEAFAGRIDDLRIYNRALSQAEIQSDLATPVGGAPPPDTTPPAVTITAPAEGATLRGTVTLVAAATDDVGVARVEFYLGGALLGTDSAAPYALSWNTTGVPAGGYSLTAVAFDPASNQAASPPVGVVVDDSPPPAPNSIDFRPNVAYAYDYGTQTSLPAAFGGGEFTLELWIRPDASFPVGPTTAGTAGQLTNWSSADNAPYSSSSWWYEGNFLLDGHNNAAFASGTFSLQFYGGGRLRWLFGDGTNPGSGGVRSVGAYPASGAPSLLDGLWHQVTLVRRWSGASSAALEMWIDGALAASATSPARTDMRTYWDGWSGFPNGQAGWFWGAEKQAAIGALSQYEDYKGLLDEVRFWSRAKTPEEIAASWAAAVTGTEPGLVGLYSFDTGTGLSFCNALSAGSHCIALTNMQSGYWSGEDAPLVPPAPDTAAPVRSGGSPSGTLPPGTTQATLSLATNESATCRYATSPGTPYAAMPGAFSTTGGLSHSTVVGGLANGGSYSYSVRCQDAAGNANADDYPIAFSVAASAPATVTFDSPVPPGSPDSLLGTYQGINFNNLWRWSGPYAADPTRSAYFSSDVPSRTFTFSGGPRLLESLLAYTASGTGTLTLSDDRGQSRTLNVTAGTLVLVATGWSLPSTTVTVAFTGGWDLGVDDITHR